MIFEFDPDKAKTNLHKHCVSFSHAEQVFHDPLGFTLEDPDVYDEAAQYHA